MTNKEEKKAKKLAELAEAISEFIGTHDMRNLHPLRKDEIIAEFSYAKEKHVRKAIKEIR